jgi:hypothetical protein
MAGQICHSFGMKLGDTLNGYFDQLKRGYAVLKGEVDKIAKDDVCLICFEVV